VVDIFREVDEELRHERYQQLWRRYGRYVIAVAIAVVLVVAGYEGWTGYVRSQRADEGARFAAALETARAGNAAAAADAFAGLARDAGAGYAILARFQEAARRAQAGDAAGAVAIYDSLAADDGLDPAFHGLAVVLATLHGLDSGDPEALAARLAPLLTAESPWRHSARELAALIVLRAGETARAGDLLRQLADDPEAPQGARGRAAELIAVLDG